MIKPKLTIIAAFLLITAATMSGALTIKLGSLAPKGTPWEQALNKLRAEWLKLSNNTIDLKIYSGGTAGDELDMLRKMRIGQLNAAALSLLGLDRIYPGSYVLQIPLLIKNLDEFKYLLEKLKPTFDKEYEAKGFKVLLWEHTGWVYLFSRKPVITPEDLKHQKLFVNEKSVELVNAFSKLGFSPVPMKDVDVVLQFQTGGLDAMIMSPFYINSYYLYSITKYMSNLRWASFIGGMVVSLDTWNKIPKDLQVKLEKSADGISLDMEKEWATKEDEAISAMKKNGLVVNALTDKGVKEWDELIETGYQQILGGQFNKALYDQAKQILNDYRKLHGK